MEFFKHVIVHHQGSDHAYDLNKNFANMNKEIKKSLQLLLSDVIWPILWIFVLYVKPYIKAYHLRPIST